MCLNFPLYIVKDYRIVLEHHTIFLANVRREFWCLQHARNAHAKLIPFNLIPTIHAHIHFSRLLVKHERRVPHVYVGKAGVFVHVCTDRGTNVVYSITRGVKVQWVGDVCVFVRNSIVPYLRLEFPTFVAMHAHRPSRIGFGD